MDIVLVVVTVANMRTDTDSDTDTETSTHAFWLRNSKKIQSFLASQRTEWTASGRVLSSPSPPLSFSLPHTLSTVAHKLCKQTEKPKWLWAKDVASHTHNANTPQGEVWTGVGGGTTCIHEIQISSSIWRQRQQQQSS